MGERKSIFWGWYVVMGAFLVTSISYGARYSFGVFVKPMSLEYGWSRSVVSLGASINMMVYSLSAIFLGRMIDRVAPRWIITAGAIFGSLSYILTGLAGSPLCFYLAYGVLCGASTACLGLLVVNSSVGKWFVRKRGIAIGISTMGVSFGTIALAPLAGYIVKNYDWHYGFIFLAALIALIGVSLSQLLMGRTNPESYGFFPDGERREPQILETGHVGEESPLQLSSKVIFQNSQFWILSATFALAVMTLMAVFVHQVAYALDRNIDDVVAASSLGALGFGGFCGQFFFGWFSDRLKDVKYSAALGIIVMAAGMVLLLQATTAQRLYLYALVYGFGYGSLGPMMPILIADRFGRHVLGHVYGWLTFFMGMGGGLGPFLGGLIYDWSGSYTYVWQANIMILIGCACLILALRSRRGLERET
ncbi:MAG TPA: MFS transporter [Syntrophales bacterium]|nr:MFS transporter [Syntrophales bacterium]